MSQLLIEQIVKDVKKQMNAETIDEYDEFSSIGFWVTSGVPDLDLLMSTFGYFPCIAEVAGKSRSGKTTLLLHGIKEFLRIGGVAFTLSTERRERQNNVLKMGINPKHYLIKKVKTIEDAFNKAENFIEIVREKNPNIPILIGLDSLGATPTKAELNPKKEDQEYMAVAARVIRGRLRRITQLIDDEKILFFIVNQTYDKVGQVFGKKTTSYGGEGLKFHRSLGLETTKIKTIKIGEKKVGQFTRFEITKSDFTMPEKYVDVPLLWGYGYVPSKEVLNLAEEQNVLVKHGKGGYSFVKIPSISWKSETEFYRMLIEEKTKRDLINKVLTKCVHEEIKIQRGMK